MEFDLTDRQLDVMNVLWERGSATVREARQDIEDELAYTSVLTVFQTLEENDLVRHEQEGRAYRYYPTITRSEAGSQAVRYVLDRILGGSVSRVLKAVVEAADWTEKELEETRRLLGFENSQP